MVKVRLSWHKLFISCLIMFASLPYTVYANSEPMTYSEVSESIHQVCADQYPNIDEDLVQAICWHESGYKAYAVNFDGSCVGLMQVSTYWNSERAERLGVKDFFDPVQNITIGVDVLNYYLERYDDLTLAIMLYGMNHDEAWELYEKGVIPEFAQEILELYKSFKGGVLDAQIESD